jgi:mono/diheme cytochrome c family protein
MRLFSTIILVISIPIFIGANLNSSELNLEASPNEPWVAPASYDKFKNPIKDIELASQEAKKVFDVQCAICHGSNGEGDGVAGMGLNPRPADLTSDLVQEQSDGALFYKLTVGRPPMAAYKEILTANERWQMVSFIRTLKE